MKKSVKKLNPSNRINPYHKLTKCPKCGAEEIKRLGGSWCSMNNYLKGSGGITIRVEVCLKCPFVRKVYRIYPDNKESDWREF